MDVRFNKPELQQFVDDQVKSGHFASPEAVVEAAVELMRFSSEYELDQDDLAAIEEGDAQLERGEGRPWEELRAELKAKYLR
jgi:Arc/MetJ-type ribon-helix-helix transcriptional regulator